MNTLPDGLALALAGRYTIEREIGFGGMATVFLAQDVKHRRPVAVKVLKSELAATIGAERFLREIEIAAQLNHPHILPLLDSGDANGFLHYVMPYVSGDSLRNRLNTGEPLVLDSVVRIASQVAGALEHAHRLGVVHRDVKPENILFSEGLAVVADFGIAKALSSVSQDVLTRSGFPVGTLGYMSPEQAAGNTDLDPRTDVCSLACVVFEMLIGTTPGVWTMPEEVRTGRFMHLSAGHRNKLDLFPGRVEQALTKGLAIRPEERFGSPSEFVEALERSTSPTKKLDNAEVDKILARASEFDADENPDAAALSMGGIEQVAAQVGIAPEQVRKAAMVADEPSVEIGRGGYFGVNGKIYLDKVVEAETSPELYGVLLNEVRSEIGQAGQVSETFDKSLLWEGRLASVSARKVQLQVQPCDGGTRIQIKESTGEDLAVTIVSIVAGSALSAAIFAGVNSADGPLAAFIVGAGFWFAQYTTCRTWYQSFVKKRKTALTELIDRVANRIADPKKSISAPANENSDIEQTG